MRRVLICGDRNWTNYDRILACVHKADKTEKIDVVIQGDCRGADRMGLGAAVSIGLTVENGGCLSYPANWTKFKKAAGPIRNQQMLDEGKPTEVWAFHNDIAHSSGTANMVKLSRKAGIPVYVITDTNWTFYPGCSDEPTLL